jgi:transcriptional regulator with XRE-family HTH domain
VLLYNVSMPNVSQLKDLGSLIRAAREAEGWSLKELSEKSGVGYSYASNIERGYVNPKRGPVTPSDDVLFALAKTLRMPISKLHGSLGRTDPADYEFGPIETIILERGYSADELTEEGRDQLRRSLDALIVGIVEQERKARIKKR